jgi:ATP-dependent DNA ligase
MVREYFNAMLSRRVRTDDGFIDPCIPTLAARPPSGPDWVHEIKPDGYRLIVRCDGAAMALFTRGGYDWTDRFPAIAVAAAKLRAKEAGGRQRTRAHLLCGKGALSPLW